MITRIVKMTIRANDCERFEELFLNAKDTIAAMQGCVSLRLWQDAHEKRIYFTYSVWESEHYLDCYRYSAFFKALWTETKTTFDEKAQAWSVDEKLIVK